MVTFVLATYALVAFVHISNISAVTDLILTKLFGPIFGGLIYEDQNFLAKPLFTQIFFEANIFLTKNLLDLHFFEPDFFSDLTLLDQ